MALPTNNTANANKRDNLANSTQTKPVNIQTAEQQRIDAQSNGTAAWRDWGPYLSERQWGTVREDYSADGEAWDYFSHDHARSRAYRWGEDGIAGISDMHPATLLRIGLLEWT